MDRSHFFGPNEYSSYIEEVKKQYNSDKNLAFASFDISNFKYLNDFYGIQEGDNVLNEFAKYYFFDDSNCLCAHNLGADQYRAIYDIKDFSEKDIVNIVTEKNDMFEKILEEKYPLVYNHVYCGIYFCKASNEKYDDVRIPIDKAHIAKKVIKGKYSVKCNVYKDRDSNVSYEFMKISNEFLQACENKRICLYLQPKVLSSKKQVIGAEALCRIIDEDNNIIMPGTFVPILEKTGMIGKLDEIMIEKVFAFQKDWKLRYGNNIPISVNVSRTKFMEDSFADFVIKLQQKYDVNPSMVEFELLESTFVDDMDGIVDTIERLRNYGFKISVDDFGSGYSSLNQIANIPADTIKLDRIFASKSLKTEKGRAVVKALISMLNDIEYNIVFEGVEEQEEKNTINEFGCDVIQGYLYSKPVSCEEFEKKYGEDLFIK